MNDCWVGHPTVTYSLHVHQTWEIKWAYEISTVWFLEHLYNATSVEMPVWTVEIPRGFTSTWRTTGNQRLLKKKGSFSSREKRFSLWPMLLTPVDSWIWFLDSSLEILDTVYLFSIQWSLEMVLSLLYLSSTSDILSSASLHYRSDYFHHGLQLFHWFFSFLVFLYDSFSKSEFPC